MRQDTAIHVKLTHKHTLLSSIWDLYADTVQLDHLDACQPIVLKRMLKKPLSLSHPSSCLFSESLHLFEHYLQMLFQMQQNSEDKKDISHAPTNTLELSITPPPLTISHLVH